VRIKAYRRKEETKSVESRNCWLAFHQLMNPILCKHFTFPLCFKVNLQNRISITQLVSRLSTLDCALHCVLWNPSSRLLYFHPSSNSCAYIGPASCGTLDSILKVIAFVFIPIYFLFFSQNIGNIWEKESWTWNVLGRKRLQKYEIAFPWIQKWAKHKR